MIRGIRTTRRMVIRAVSLIGMVVALILANSPAMAVEFQLRAAINDPANETVSALGNTQSGVVNTNDSTGAWLQLIPGQPYSLEVSGTYQYSPNSPYFIADGECSSYNGSPFVPERYTQSHGADFLDVVAAQNAQVTRFDWAPVSPPTSGDPRCSTTHTYQASFTPGYSTSWIHFYLSDPWSGDNVGSLNIKASRGAFSAPAVFQGAAYSCPKWSEEAVTDNGFRIGEIGTAELIVDSFRPWTHESKPYLDKANNPYWWESGHYGVYTCNWALPGSVYRITATGGWDYNMDTRPFGLPVEDPVAAHHEHLGGTHDHVHEEFDERTDHAHTGLHTADAECSTGLHDDVLLPNRYPASPHDPSNRDRDWMDLYINYENVQWNPVSPDATGFCSTTNTYTLDYSPQIAGPIRFQIYDFQYEEWNNCGHLNIKVERIA